MRRVALLLTLVITGVIIASILGSAGAQTSTKECTTPTGKGKTQTITCVTTTVTETTEFVERQATEFVDRTEIDKEVSTATEFVERSATGPCEVGNSGRVGTAEGIETDEVLVTTTETFEVTLRDEFLVTLQDEILVTTTTVITEVFNGPTPNPNKLVSTTTSPPEEDEELVDTTEVGRQLQGTTEVSRDLVDTDVQREVQSTNFEATGRCKNIPGPQNEEAVENANPRALEPRPRGNQLTEELPVETPVDEPRGNRPADTPRGNQPTDLPRGGQPEERIEEVLPEEVDEL